MLSKLYFWGFQNIQIFSFSYFPSACITLRFSCRWAKGKSVRHQSTSVTRKWRGTYITVVNMWMQASLKDLDGARWNEPLEFNILQRVYAPTILLFLLFQQYSWVIMAFSELQHKHFPTSLLQNSVGQGQFSVRCHMLLANHPRLWTSHSIILNHRFYICHLGNDIYSPPHSRDCCEDQMR